MPKKSKTAAERRHMDAVAQLGCICCHKMGYDDSPAELHHIKEQTGMGLRSSHYEVIPLCPMHHRSSDVAYHVAPAKFTAKWGSQRSLLEYTMDMLGKKLGYQMAQKKGSN
tara:strand:- start:59 stop:391 length:333 start_codon:yes stop_codon:yes gene_type:complete